MQKTRHKRLKALIRKLDVNPERYDKDVEEDLRPYLSGKKEIQRYAAVTLHHYDEGGFKHFIYPAYDTRRGAQDRAVEFAHDDIFAEGPVMVVNLDTGATYTAKTKWVKE